MANFSAFNLSKTMIDSLNKQGYVEPSPIQTSIIPRALRGQSLIAQSPTGSGKTHSYLIPIIDKVDQNLPRLQAIIVCPSRELARQVYEFARPFQKHFQKLKIRLFTSESDKSENQSGLSEAPQIVIGTPGRLKDILIDEYDSPMLTVLHDKERLEHMRTALQSFYAPLKDLDPYLRFVFITGITKFSQLSVFSQLNNLVKISMMPEYSAICGITQEELEENFEDGIVHLGQRNGMSQAEVLDALKNKYDGYHFSHSSPGVYNPFSLLSAMYSRELHNYWFETGTPGFLISQLRKFGTDITRLDGSVADASEFDAPTEDMHSILPLLYQSGYLTIKNYDNSYDEYILGFPNEEVKVGFTRMLIPFYVSSDTNGATNACRQICRALTDDHIDAALTAAQSFFAAIPYQEGTLKNAPAAEGHFTAMLYVMFSFLNRYVWSQVRVALGRMDILVKTVSTIYVMELKLDGSVEEALKQIDNKGYAIPWKEDGRKVVKVGISFSSEKRTISEWKVRQSA